MELTEKNLKNGCAFVFRTPTEMDDFRELTIEYTNKFAIWFNGSLIHTCKTYRSALKKLNDVKNRWELIFDRIENKI